MQSSGFQVQQKGCLTSHNIRPLNMASAFLTCFRGPMMKTLSGAPFDPLIRISALHDSLIDKIEDPFLPMTHPIFPGGTSSMDKISSSKVSLSTLRNSGIEGIAGQSAYSLSLMQKHRQQSEPRTASLHNDSSLNFSIILWNTYGRNRTSSAAARTISSDNGR